MAGRFWKEAATLIIVGRASVPNCQLKAIQEMDYNLLFLKRSQKSSFMPNAFVFPGGVTEKSDFSTDWLEVFKKCGYSAEDFHYQFRNDTTLPEFYSNKSSSSLLPEVGMRITAIRETFEECGILLASNLSKQSYDQIIDKDWSKIVHNDASQFITLFQEYGGCPAVFDLHEWSAWLTPVTMKKRFDTAFYITFVDEISNVFADRKEIEELQVSSPNRILNQSLNDLWLPPPQAYEMCRFLQFRLYDKLKEFAISRGKMGVESWCPVRFAATDGFVNVLPGDDLYPKDPSHVEKAAKPVMLDATIEELKQNAKCLHRVEFRSMKDYSIVVNIIPRYGQVLPLSYNDWLESSKL